MELINLDCQRPSLSPNLPFHHRLHNWDIIQLNNNRELKSEKESKRVSKALTREDSPEADFIVIERRFFFFFHSLFRLSVSKSVSQSRMWRRRPHTRTNLSPSHTHSWIKSFHGGWLYWLSLARAHTHSLDSKEWNENIMWRRRARKYSRHSR